jgi:K+-sensing histidine kinase KdpD
MEDGSERLFYLGAGPLAALLLGMALVPLRDFTTASNFTFLFLVLTIAVAEFGGRWPAVATALCSALSLNFFLTRPYLKLTIEGKNDVIAFLGLTACGLLVAALASQRGERTASLTGAQSRLDLLHSALGQWRRGVALEPRLAEVLRACQAAFPITAVAVRDEHNRVLAVSGHGPNTIAVPAQVLRPETLLPAEDAGLEPTRPAAALSPEGVRLALVVDNRPVGWLDVWGRGGRAGPELREALCDVAGLLALMLATEAARAGRALE